MAESEELPERDGEEPMKKKEQTIQRIDSITHHKKSATSFFFFFFSVKNNPKQCSSLLSPSWTKKVDPVDCKLQMHQKF